MKNVFTRLMHVSMGSCRKAVIEMKTVEGDGTGGGRKVSL